MGSNLNNSFGQLRVYVYDEASGIPIANAEVYIFQSEIPHLLLYSLTTAPDGFTSIVCLTAPPLAYGMTPSYILPYSRYTLRIKAFGYQMLEIIGTQIFPQTFSTQPAALPLLDGINTKKTIVIGSNTLDWK